MTSADERRILDGLNPEQRLAVETTEGPLLIQAGAGSGKTKALIHRIAYIIASELAQPAEILAVTFTNKAANEMRGRLARLLGVADNRSFMPWMGTFHSIAVRLLRQDGDQIDIARNFVIFDEADRLSLVKSVMKELGVAEQQFSPRSIVSYISKAKNACLSPEQYRRQATQSSLQQTAAEVYDRYERRLRENVALDFDDLLLDAVQLLEKSSEVRRKYQEQFHYILIDEYQDTNKAQYRLVKLLLNDRRNICVVGDDWQSIYSWRGADYTNILNFERDFPGAKQIKLEQNYRSTEEILEAAHRVISKNTKRSDKKLWTDNRGGEPVELIVAGNEFDEAERVANQIWAMVAGGGHRLRDCAVLYRTNAQSRVFEQMFTRNSLRYRLIGGQRFYDRAEIKDLIAYLKLIYQPSDTISFRRIVNVPKRGLGEVSVTKFLAWQSGSGLNVLDALARADDCAELTSRARKTLSQLGRALSEINKLASTESPDRIIEEIMRRFDYGGYLDDGTERGEERCRNVDELISMAKEYGDLASFLEEVALVSGADAVNDDDAVTLMTLHAAKGLEYPVVFMVGMEDGLFPSARSSLEPAAAEEERRLCYVGMTRAQEKLVLSYARRRMLRGETHYSLPSPFVQDVSDMVSGDESGMDEVGDYQGWANYRRGSSVQHTAGHGGQASEPHYEPNPVELSLGDRVRHQIFGSGQVTSVDGQVVEVYFDDGKTRKLNVAFAPLSRADG